MEARILSPFFLKNLPLSPGILTPSEARRGKLRVGRGRKKKEGKKEKWKKMFVNNNPVLTDPS